MAAELDTRRYGEIRRSLAQLDLHHHSLKLMGQKMVSESEGGSAASSGALYERSMQLARECFSIVRDLCGYVGAEDLECCNLTLGRIDLAIEKAAGARTQTLLTVNTWRVVDATGNLLTSIGRKYGYIGLSENIAVDPMGDGDASAFARPVPGRQLAAPSRVDAVKPMTFLSFRVLSRRRVRRWLSRPGLLLGVLIVLAFAVVAVAAPALAAPEGENPYLIPRYGYSMSPRPPSSEHPLGTMESGYDVLYGLVWGTRVAFRIGLAVTFGRALIGVMLGLIAGYYGGLLDAVIMRITDAFLAFPVVAAVLLIVNFLGGTWLAVAAHQVGGLLVVSLVVFGWMQYARLVRGNVLAEREKEYIEAALSIGARVPRMIFRHILPNVPQGLFVLIASDVGAMVVLAAVFTFLGSGGILGSADWGWMLSASRNWVIGARSDAFRYWYTYVPPSLALVFFSMGWNLIGDGLRDVLDPRLR